MSQRSEAHPPGGENEDDLQLVQRARLGHRLAREVLAARLNCVTEQLAAVHYRRGRPLDEHDLADVAGEVRAALWARLDRYDGRTPLEAWAQGFCRVQLSKHLERQTRRHHLERRIYRDRQDLELHEIGSLEEDQARLQVHLQRLDPRAYRVIQLKALEGFTFEQVARTLDISPSTAKTLYYRGIEKLRQAMSRPQGS